MQVVLLVKWEHQGRTIAAFLVATVGSLLASVLSHFMRISTLCHGATARSAGTALWREAQPFVLRIFPRSYLFFPILEYFCSGWPTTSLENIRRKHAPFPTTTRDVPMCFSIKFSYDICWSRCIFIPHFTWRSLHIVYFFYCSNAFSVFLLSLFTITSHRYFSRRGGLPCLSVFAPVRFWISLAVSSPLADESPLWYRNDYFAIVQENKEERD